MYNGRTDPMDHVSHFNQRMAIHSKDETLMCKVFPSSLGPVVMRWFDSLRADSISSFKELTQMFGSRFVTCSRVPQPLASLLSLSMQEGETMKTYSDRYWKMFNEINGDFDNVAISTFKVDFPAEHDLRKFLIGKLVTSRDFAGQSRFANTQVVNAVFQEPVHQFVCKGKLKQLLRHSSGQGGQTNLESWRDDSSRLPLGTINVIFAAPGRTGSYPSRVMSVAWLSIEGTNLEPKKARIKIQPVLNFSDKDKIGTIQLHNNALVVTLRIGGYDVKRVLVDQGNGAEIIYPDLYKRLNLRLENLIAYNSPLVSFDGKVIILKGQIRLPIQTSLEVVEVDFIMVDAYSPYTANVARPWLHTLRAVSSTLH
nr:uncharacterized protein LOC111996528 [Quercus suber]